MSSCSNRSLAKKNTAIENEEEQLLNIEFCEKLEKLNNSNEPNLPSWENIESTIYELIQQELQEYSQREDELEIMVCEEDEWYVTTIKKDSDVLINARVDDLSGEYYLISK